MSPCVTLNREAVLRHSRSQSHLDAVTAETNLGMGFMESAYKEAISVEQKSMIGRFKWLYWLCKEEVAHTMKFELLLELGKSVGVEYLDAVCQGGNAQYTSSRRLFRHWQIPFEYRSAMLSRNPHAILWWSTRRRIWLFAPQSIIRLLANQSWYKVVSYSCLQRME